MRSKINEKQELEGELRNRLEHKFSSSSLFVQFFLPRLDFEDGIWFIINHEQVNFLNLGPAKPK